MTLAKIKIVAAAAVVLLAIPPTAVVIHSYVTRSAPAPEAQTAVDATPAPSPAPLIADVPATAPAPEAFAVPGNLILTIPNGVFFNYSEHPDEYQMGLDPDTKRLPDSPFAGYIQANFGDASRALKAIQLPIHEHLAGKRIRVSYWLKTLEAARSGMDVLVLGPNKNRLVVDEMGDRSVHGTTDWQRLSSVVDVPPNASQLLVKLFLNGSGEIWTDGFQIEAVGPNVPTTDDSAWKIDSDSPWNYTAEIDPETVHDGHPTLHFWSAMAETDQKADYERFDRAPQQYLGHRVRLTAWIKSAQLTHTAEPEFSALNADDDTIVESQDVLPRSVRGTSDWKMYTTYANVPKNASAIEWGIHMHGTGNLWIDLDSAKLEIADTPAP